MLSPCIIVRVADKQPISIMACKRVEHMHNALVMVMRWACVDCPARAHVAAMLSLRATCAWFRHFVRSHERATCVVTSAALFKANK